MMKPSTTDTDPDALTIQAALIREMAPAERAHKAIRMTTRLIRECKAAIRRNHADFSDEQIGIAFIELNYGSDLAREVEAHLRNSNRVDRR